MLTLEFLPTVAQPNEDDSDSDNDADSIFSGFSGFSNNSRRPRRKLKNMVSGHLGTTPAAVTGLVRITVDPSFSSKHPRIMTRPVLDVRLKGVVRTSSGPSASFLRQTPLSGLAWIDKTIINEKLSFGDPLDLGLRRDASGSLNVLLPGTYEVPFRFGLPNILPPTFKGYDGRVTYMLSAKIYFKERTTNGGFQYFDKFVTEPVVIRRYNSEHIINSSESLDLRASSPVPQYPFDIPNDLGVTTIVLPQTNANSLRSSLGIVRDQASSSSSRRPSQMSMTELNPASLSPPAQSSPTMETAEAGLMPPPLPLTRTLTGEMDVVSDNFTEPATFSNLDSEDPVRYHIIIPNRSFGPDDPIVANVHISKVPEGFEVHHIDVIVRAEITSKTQRRGGTKTTTQVIMKHRDFPEHAGSFWNRKINVNAAKLFRNQSYESVSQANGGNSSSSGGGGGNGSGSGSDATGIGNGTDESSSEPVVPTGLPPRFDAIHNELTIPRNFSSYPIVNRRNMLIDAMHGESGGSGSGVGMARSQTSATPASAVPMALDSGISAGNSSVFQPWTIAEEQRARSPSMRRTQSMDSQYGGGSLRSPSLLGAMPTFLRPRSSRVTEVIAAPESESNPRDSVSVDSNVATTGADDENDDETTGSDGNHVSENTLDSVREPDPEPVSAMNLRSNSNRMSLSIQTLSRALSMRSADSYNPRSTSSSNNQHRPPRMETPPLPPTSNTRQTLQRTTSSPPTAGAAATTITTPPATRSSPPTATQRFLKPIRKILKNLIPPAAQDTKPLNTFTSPFLSVRHVLRIQIVCHKPIPLLGGSQPIYLEPNTYELKQEAAEAPETLRISTIWKKVVPLGFRYTTIVETGCVVHPASERDRRFLQSYLYGPASSGGTPIVLDESLVPAYEGPPPLPEPLDGDGTTGLGVVVDDHIREE
ncbi:UNVERIFIED_CONTAM: hypothetical protein HDU68_010933 [Siphonaria sp. JEL0065]|nr:hypothetical protein HDU68_010933 [Siphonaria sp. JEL0065]